MFSAKLNNIANGKRVGEIRLIPVFVQSNPISNLICAKSAVSTQQDYRNNGYAQPNGFHLWELLKTVHAFQY